MRRDPGACVPACRPGSVSARCLSLPARAPGRRAGADSERHRRRRRFARDVPGPLIPRTASAGTLGRPQLPAEDKGSPAQQGMLGEAGVELEQLEEGSSSFTAIIPLFGEAGTGKFPRCWPPDPVEREACFGMGRVGLRLQLGRRWVGRV